MEISTILSADVLDIIFDGRNKEYGAYELRKGYRRRLTMSLAGMLLLIALLLLGYFLAGKTIMQQTKEITIPPDVVLKSVEEPEEIEPPPPVKKEPPPQEQIRQFTSKIRLVDEVKPDERPPEVDELEDTKIGTLNRDGVKDDGIVAPPAEDGRGVVEAPKKEVEDWEKVFLKVEIESQYPGGFSAWKRYLERNLRYPQEAMDSEIEGTVIVKFIVDKEGVVSDVEAISGPQELRAEAVRVIKKSGNWTAAVQNNIKVKSYKSQPVIFKFNHE